VQITDTAAQGAEKLAQCLAAVDEAQARALAEEIARAGAVFVAGAGRSLLMLRCLAMRLMHLGLTAYVVADTTTPAFTADDLLICASGSGTTVSVVAIAEKARSLGGRVAALTIESTSPLGELANTVVQVHAYSDKRDTGAELPVLPGGALFEQSVLLLGDALVYPLSELRQVPTDRAFDLHANLE
jgi:6-phospho-3-hexuloisomerase